jgi:intracellular septation protein
MKQFSELFPIVAFLIALWLKDIYFATAVLMAATVLQLALLMLMKHTITPMQWAVTGMVLVFGALTLGFHDERFIKIKPTVVYLAMAAAFFISNSAFKKNLVKAALGTALSPPESTWNKLNWLWIGLFVAMATVNLILAYSVPTQVWAWSKLGFFIVTMVFVGGQVYALRTYLKLPS